MKETEVGKIVIDYLKDQKETVYCEVDSGCGRIDIVSVSDSGVITAIELKNQCSFDVLGQAVDRLGFAHRSIAAFPFPKERRHKVTVVDRVARSTGIGVWIVTHGHIEEKYRPVLYRTALTHHITNYLREEQKNQEAGVNHGYWSPFKSTKQSLVNFVAKNEGCTLKEALKHVKHHYASHSSAYGSLGQWIRSGVIDEIERRDDGLLYLATGRS